MLRLIVALTPTPKDDQLVKKASGVWQKALGGIAVIFGLDTTQGIKSDGSTKKSTIVSIVLCCMILGMWSNGCQTIMQSEGAKLSATQKSFASTVRILATLRAADQLSDKDQEAITLIINQANSYLLEWEASYQVGATRPDLHSIMMKTIATLEKFILADESAAVDPNS